MPANPFPTLTTLLRTLALTIPIALAGLGAAGATSVTYQVLLESDTDAPTGSEVYLITYPDIDALNAGSLSSAGFTQIGISPGFSIAGFAYDGAYQVLLESDTDAPTGSEVYLITYPDIDALNAGSLSSAGFTQIGISPGFSIAGFAYDGAYQVLLESDTDAPTGSEVYLITYPDIDQLVAGTFLEAGFTQIGISPGFSIAAFAYDGAYRVLLESDGDAPTGSEVYLITYPDVDALRAGSLSSAGFTQIGISPGFSIAGLAAVASAPSSDPGPAPIPLPAAGWLLLSGLGLLDAMRRRSGSGRVRVRSALRVVT